VGHGRVVGLANSSEMSEPRNQVAIDEDLGSDRSNNIYRLQITPFEVFADDIAAQQSRLDGAAETRYTPASVSHSQDRPVGRFSDE
jgi:hypothetical protein